MFSLRISSISTFFKGRKLPLFKERSSFQLPVYWRCLRAAGLPFSSCSHLGNIACPLWREVNSQGSFQPVPGPLPRCLLNMVRACTWGENTEETAISVWLRATKALGVVARRQRVEEEAGFASGRPESVSWLHNRPAALPRDWVLPLRSGSD